MSSARNVEPTDPEGATGATLLLRRSVAGDAGAAERLLPVVYDELRSLAAAYLKRERANHTLQATALVHEAWVRLIDRRDARQADREHFLALAARAMQRVLIDHARGRLAERRGGRLERVTLVSSDRITLGNEVSLVDLVDLIDRLSEEHARMADVVTMHTLSGLTFVEIANVLGVSESTVFADWRVAKAWMSRELGGDDKP